MECSRYVAKGEYDGEVNKSTNTLLCFPHLFIGLLPFVTDTLVLYQPRTGRFTRELRSA